MSGFRKLFLMNITNKAHWIKILTGFVIFASVAWLPFLQTSDRSINFTLATAALMAYYWITETLPIAVTSLLPMICFPLTGVMDGKSVAAQYFNHVIFLFIGGFLIALAMQKWNLHKRIALNIILQFGKSRKKVLLGFMITASFLSMWISNTATAMMMLPIGISVIQSYQFDEKNTSFPRALLLGIAYSCSVGGIATLIGTPPNLVMVKMLGIFYPGTLEITFSQWMFFALPVSLVLFISVYLVLTIKYRFSDKIGGRQSVSLFRERLQELGSISYEEKWVLIIFITMAFLWMFRQDIVIGQFKLPGWSGIFPHPEYINDGVVAITMGFILFIIPSKNQVKCQIMEWKDVKELPWNVVLLFGGGFALAEAFVQSGLSKWLENHISTWLDFHPIALVGIITMLVVFLTEVTSNTATTSMFLPILASLSAGLGQNPLLLMLPATLAASMAFMMPVATPPNAIVFGSGYLRMKDMATTGLIINFIAIIIITLLTWFWGKQVFGIIL